MDPPDQYRNDLRRIRCSSPLAPASSQPILLTVVMILDEFSDLEPFTHTTLRFLYIACPQDKPASQLSDLFDTLTLPNLRMFKVTGEPPWPHEEFKAFRTRSKCPLDTLVFNAELKTRRKQRAEYVALIPSLEVPVLQEEA
ncbi:hypothetical protein EDB19DRAFT_1832599 [Suillus lakei]|nr:hypothetical protein EDB19DRAFT_1832599 [Suillus lakei]